MAQHKVVVCAGFLVYRRFHSQVQYLLLQASDGQYHWGPPKGHADEGETELETAFRETKEEAGLDKEEMRIIEQFKTVLEYQAFGKPKRVVYWLSELKNPETPVVLSHEHQQFKWLDLEKALEYAQFENMQELIRNADKFLASNS